MNATHHLESANLETTLLKNSASSQRFIKRIFDLIVAFFAILIISPLYILIAIALKMTDRGPVFYSHRRVGRYGKEFGCLKFRTMVMNGDQVLREHLASNPEARMEWLLNRKLRVDPRVTPIGRILRKSSLDEIPQLFNVLTGEMSIVGPRPVMMDELVHYAARKTFYFAVRPGITGLWQISGRSELSYEDRVDFDCEYVENWRFSRDLVIIARTIPVVWSTKGSC